MNVRPGELVFQCNICGTLEIMRPGEVTRESDSCRTCHSTPRYRALMAVLSRELFGTVIPIQEFPVHKELVGIGMSDWLPYAKVLEEKFTYRNTYYHQEPRLDILNIPKEMEGTLDFIISTEVFEHVAPPVATAFRNAKRLLKPDGVMIFTVPFVVDPEAAETVEHFPNLHEYEIVERDGGRVLVNRTKDGKTEEFTKLNFHGGEGWALEMRLFSSRSLLREFSNAGFAQTEVILPVFECGACWPQASSRPVVARVTTKRAPLPLPETEPIPFITYAEKIAEEERERLRARTEALSAELHEIQGSRSWRFVNVYWEFVKKVRRMFGRA